MAWNGVSQQVRKKERNLGTWLSGKRLAFDQFYFRESPSNGFG